MGEVPRRVILSGYYGFGNAGDDAILLALAEALRRRGVAELLVPGGPLTLPVEGVRWWPRYAFGRLRRELRRGAVLLSGGGGLLQDTTSLRSVGYYTAVMNLARRAWRPYAVIAQSLGPLTRPLARRWARRALAGATVVTVRDEGSRALAVELGLAPAAVEVLGDPVFLLPPPEVTPAAPPRLGLCLRDTAHTATVLAAVTDWLPHRPPGCEVVALPCCAADEALGAALGEAVRPTAYAGVDNLRRELAACRLVVAERLHALIFAVAAGVPAVAIDYDPKVGGLARDLAAPLAGRDADLTGAGLTAAVDAAWSVAETLGERFRAGAEARRERLEEGLDRVLAALAAGESE